MNGWPYSLTALVVMVTWVPIVITMFALMRPRRAVILAFVAGYLFMPDIGYTFHTLPDANKVSLTCLGVIIGSLIFDGPRLFMVRPRLIDLAWLILMLAPLGASLANDLGIMDGLSASINLMFRWGLGYWIGRAYFTDWEGIRELAMGIVFGGLTYVPLCWWEIRMSPQLHGQIYGLLFSSFRDDTYIFGIKLFGFRPNVFLQDGLTVTMYMGVASVLAFWAWMTGSPKRLLGVPMGVITLALIVTAFFSKGVGGIALMFIGMLLLTITSKWPRTRVPILILMLAAPAYITVRAAGEWTGDFLVESAKAVSPARAESLEFRLDNEKMLIGKALKQPLLGWGGWSRSHVFDRDNKDLTIIDGLWILLMGETGLIGLTAFCIMVIGPALLIWKRIPTRFWSDPACAAAVALAVVITMYMLDSLFNATFNQVAVLTIGAVVSIGGVAKDVFNRSARRAIAQSASAYSSRVVAVVASPKDLPYVYSGYRS